MFIRCFCFWLLCLALPLRAASDPQPLAGPGASKDEVVRTYGQPKGQSRAGEKEILNYPQAQVILNEGRVEHVSVTGGSSVDVRRRTGGPVRWLSSFDAALSEAKSRQIPILVLFGGYDWSPASRQFVDDVASQPEFAAAFDEEFVFLRLEYPMRTPLPDAQRAENEQLRARYGVTVFPSLLELSAEGEKRQVVDLARPRAGATYRARMMAAVRELRPALAQPEAVAVPAAPATVYVPVPTDPQMAESLLSARKVVIAALAAGGLMAAALMWLLWRNWSRPAKERRAEIASRIDEAASGLPTLREINAWPKERLVVVAARIAETDGYTARICAADTDRELDLVRPAEELPCVYVRCSVGTKGPVATKSMRELVAAMTAGGVLAGWFVSPAGFTSEARYFGDEHSILLLDGYHLLARLRDLPPLVQSRVLAH